MEYLEHCKRKSLIPVSFNDGGICSQKKSGEKNWMLIAQVTVFGCLVNRADTVPGVSGLLIATLPRFQVWK